MDYVIANSFDKTCVISGPYGNLRFPIENSGDGVAGTNWEFENMESINGGQYSSEGATNGQYFMFGSQTDFSIWKVKNDNSDSIADGWQQGNMNDQTKIFAGIDGMQNQINNNADGGPTAKGESKVWTIAYSKGLDMWLGSTPKTNIFYSKNDGEDWTYAVVNNGAVSDNGNTRLFEGDNHFTHIYYNQPKYLQYGFHEFLAITNTGCVFMSNNGKTWYGHTCVTRSYQAAHGIIYGKGRYIIFTANGDVYYTNLHKEYSSSTNWNRIDNIKYIDADGVANYNINALQEGEWIGGYYSEDVGRMVIVGDRNFIIYSDDGVTWHWNDDDWNEIGGYGAGKRLQVVWYYNNKWFAFGSGAAENGEIYYYTSDDNAVNWNKVNELENIDSMDLNFGSGSIGNRMGLTCNVVLDKCAITRDYWSVNNCCNDFSDSSCYKSEKDYKRNDCCPNRGL